MQWLAVSGYTSIKSLKSCHRNGKAENHGALRMNKYLFLIFLTLSITNCTTMQNSTSVLYDKYYQYDRIASKSNIIEVAEDFFSPSLLGKNYQTNQETINQLLFKNYMVVEDSHHEQINEQKGCLTINGYDEENTPLIFSLKYILKNSRWLIDRIHVVFIDDVSDFVNSAKCPSMKRRTSDYPG
jgi:hypothetical protein